MLIPMLDFGEMHKVTLVFVIIELMMLTYQLLYYFARPSDKSRLYYLILLCLLIVFNIIGGFFPDPKIKFVSINFQNIIAYGSGFLVGSYFPFYFYKNFNLKELELQVLYGVPMFLLFPFLLFFVVIYTTVGDLTIAINYGLVIPFLYSVYLLWVILGAIRAKFKTPTISVYPAEKLEIVGVYCAIVPWVSLSIFPYFNVTQWVEVLVANAGFVLLTVIFMIRSVVKARMEDKRYLAIMAAKEDEFQKYCLKYGLTMQQERVADLLCRGYSYKEIASTLFVSKKTVDTHIQHIFLKTGVNRKFQLMQKLGLADIDYSFLNNTL